MLPGDKNQKQKTESFGLISKELTGYTPDRRRTFVNSQLINNKKKKLHEYRHDMNENAFSDFNLLSNVLRFSCCCVSFPRETWTSIYSPQIGNQRQMKRVTSYVQLGEAMSLECTHGNMGEELFPGESVTNSIYHYRSPAHRGWPCPRSCTDVGNCDCLHSVYFRSILQGYVKWGQMGTNRG